MEDIDRSFMLWRTYFEVSSNNQNMDDIEANVRNKKLRFLSTKNRFLIIATIIIILFSIMAFGFGVYATIQVTKKTKTFEDLNSVFLRSSEEQNQVALKLFRFIEFSRNQSQTVERKMLEIRRLIEYNWELKVKEFNARMKYLENVLHYDSTNSRIKSVENTLDKIGSRVTKMTSRVKQLEYSRNKRQERDQALKNDNVTALPFVIEDFKFKNLL